MTSCNDDGALEDFDDFDDVVFNGRERTNRRLGQSLTIAGDGNNYDGGYPKYGVCTRKNLFAMLLELSRNRGFYRRGPSYQCSKAVFYQVCNECQYDVDCFLDFRESLGRDTAECTNSNNQRW